MMYLQLNRGSNLLNKVVSSGIVVFFCLATAVCALAQDGSTSSTKSPPPPRGQRAAMNYPTAALVSPEVHPDRTVTLRFCAPQAAEVKVTGEITQGKGPQPMVKGNDGVWTITLGPLPPEIWSYNFRIEGIDVLDPSNPALKPVPPGQVTSNFVEVPTDKPADYDVQPAPHGEVRMKLYESPVMGFARSLWVYTPPGYDRGTQRYPVLYLLHGNGETQAGWVTNGRANLILDNLIAQGKAKPMIVVMPQGHALQAQGVEPLKRVSGETSMFSPLFEPDLLNVIMPMIEKEFRVAPGPDSRAIAGLSMGGGQSLSIGLSHPDLFHYVLGFSSAIGPNFLNIDDLVKKLNADPSIVNAKLKLLWISCGKQDFLYSETQKLNTDFDEHGIRHKYIQTEGAHVWSVWRNNLEAALPLMFR